MLPNPHVFPIAPYPGPAPELAARSGQGSWPAYAVTGPADRLLPFVVTRLRVPGNSAWLNCASIVDADTGELVETLTVTGPAPGQPGALGLVLDKVVDVVNGVEHFIYYGAIIPSLNLPCGRPLRLLLDTHYQSVRFTAIGNLLGYQRLEWSHPGPLNGIPYGSGFVQRLYVLNGGLQYADPRTVTVSTQDAATGALRSDSVSQYATRTATAGPLPRYLADAVAGALAHQAFTVDGQAWRLTQAKSTPTGPDGGQWVMELTVESLTALSSTASCQPQPLPSLPYHPLTDGPRGWRCGDTADTAPEWQTESYVCALDGDNRNTGQVNETQRDVNPQSASYNTTRPHDGGQDLTRCPLPTLYYSRAVSSTATRNDCGSGMAGTAEVYSLPEGARSSYVSRDDATALAQQVADAGAQAYANANGSCVPVGGGVTYQPLYDEKGCFTCLMANTADSTDIRAATGQEVDQYRVNNVFYQGRIEECPACTA